MFSACCKAICCCRKRPRTDGQRVPAGGLDCGCLEEAVGSCTDGDQRTRFVKLQLRGRSLTAEHSDSEIVLEPMTKFPGRSRFEVESGHACSVSRTDQSLGFPVDSYYNLVRSERISREWTKKRNYPLSRAFELCDCCFGGLSSIQQNRADAKQRQRATKRSDNARKPTFDDAFIGPHVRSRGDVVKQIPRPAKHSRRKRRGAQRRRRNSRS